MRLRILILHEKAGYHTIAQKVSEQKCKHILVIEHRVPLVYMQKQKFFG